MISAKIRIVSKILAVCIRSATIWNWNDVFVCVQRYGYLLLDNIHYKFNMDHHFFYRVTWVSKLTSTKNEGRMYAGDCRWSQPLPRNRQIWSPVGLTAPNLGRRGETLPRDRQNDDAIGPVTSISRFCSMNLWPPCASGKGVDGNRSARRKFFLTQYQQINSFSRRLLITFFGRLDGYFIPLRERDCGSSNPRFTSIP